MVSRGGAEGCRIVFVYCVCRATAGEDEDESSVVGRERFNLLINIGQEELLFARRESKLLNANYIA